MNACLHEVTIRVDDAFVDPWGLGIGDPFCGHKMCDHHLFKGNYEQPSPEVSCVSEEINPRTLGPCGCGGPPYRWTDEELAWIPR